MGDLVGQQLGNYRLRRLLGQGSFADVYLGEHIHLGTQAAIKVLQVRLVENNVQNFLNEARTIAHLVHPYIIRVLDFGVHNSIPFLVMDYAPKGTFRQRFLQLGKPLPPAPLVSYMRQTAAALQYAHDHKLIHRDVKPENMLMGPNDEVLLTDFGFALMAQSAPSHALSEEAAGTATYMAPEQLQGKSRPASDQYALGIIAYEWLCGSRPFEGSFIEIASQQMLAQPPLLHEKVPTIAREVESVVMTALAKDPQKRFAHVRDFALALEDACLLARQYDFDLPSIPPPADKIATSALPPVDFAASFDTGARPALTAQLSGPNSEAPYDDQSMQQAAQNNAGMTSFRSRAFPASQSSRTKQLAPEEQSVFSDLSASALPAQTDLPPSVSFPQPPAGKLSPFRPVPAEQKAFKERSALSNLSSFNPGQFLPTAPQVQDASPPYAKARHSLSRVNVMLIAVLLIVVVSSVGLLYIINKGTASGSMVTTNAAGNARHPTQAAAAASATAASNLKDPYAPYNGVLALNDPLRNNHDNRWSEVVGPAAGMLCQFMQDGYYVAAPTNVANNCLATNTAYTNFTYEISLRFVKTATQYSSAGIIFRANQQTGQYYRFGVYASGRYSLDRCVNKVCTIVVDGETGAPLPSFKVSTGGIYPLNTLAVVVRNNTFAIYVNDQLAFAPFTATKVISTQGMIGVFAAGGINATTEAVFSNARVWKLA